MTVQTTRRGLILTGAAAFALQACSKSESEGAAGAAGGALTLLNVSYDPTRELYRGTSSTR